MIARKKAVFLLCLALVLLAALCGVLIARGRAAGRPVPPKTAAPTATAEPEAAPAADEAGDGVIAFFGDSLTSGENWSGRFPEHTVVNLGIAGDTVADMTERVAGIRESGADRVFVLGGINSLMNMPADSVLAQYEDMLESIARQCPGIRIHVLSVLPIGREWENGACDNEMIAAFNGRLQALAEERGAVYIDLYSAYLSDGCLDASATYDGVHLTEAGYDRWVEALEPYMDKSF